VIEREVVALKSKDFQLWSFRQFRADLAQKIFVQIQIDSLTKEIIKTNNFLSVF
jgi:hypothetical protein